MDALSELLSKPNEEYTALEAAVVFLYGKHVDDAMEAATELSALRAAVAAAREALQEFYNYRANFITAVGLAKKEMEYVPLGVCQKWQFERRIAELEAIADKWSNQEAALSKLEGG
jgi:chorismate mutase